MSEDGQLKQDVLEALNWEPSVTAAYIGVTARNGVVSLSGHVASYTEKFAAEKAAGRVKGVKAIAETLEVHLPFDLKKADDEIAAAAVDRLAWNSSVPLDAVKVKVEKGWVTLSGQVDWHFQQEAAARDIGQLLGVVGVSNIVAVKAKVDTSDLSHNIRTALHRAWFYEPDTITVTAKDGKVKLTGTVDTWHERDIAATTAWAARGATDVENDIRVN